ncbi:MAG TPA: hypothetical protein VM936_08050 [Pyrinomonadaceae bacterium]|jgi:hypothetical protein|nr:hypothetical protein [Pyrinomonadaceae bacterium]
MAARLTVLFYIVLCLEAGVFLTVLPWVGGGSYWGDNYFLVLAAQKIGAVGLQRAVASGWVRGAVTGLGILNLAMAFWEIFHFNAAVRRLQGAERPAPPASAHGAVALNSVQARTTPQSLPSNEAHEDAAPATQADHVSHHGRRDE